jgi:glycine cleavage system protein P-like pyridoxal-binding family
MASRITGKKKVLISRVINPDKLSKIRDYLKPEIGIELVDFDRDSGLLDLESYQEKLTSDFAAVYLENPSYFGYLESNARQIADLARSQGVLNVVSVDPISLGVINPPVEYGADIVCGDIQPLGMHMQYGGGQAGFIATRDEETFVMEYPSRLFGVAPTIVEGEYGFGDVAYERTSFAKREGGKEWVGTASALWGITAGIYLALMGPQGMLEIGEAILQRTRYAMKMIAEIEGIQVLFSDSHHFKEFVVNFDGTGKNVDSVNQDLLDNKIFGGKDIREGYQHRIPRTGAKRNILRDGNPQPSGYRSTGGNFSGGDEMSIAIGKKPPLRRFHQARWDEPVIFELSQPGQRGVLVPEVESGIHQEVGDVASALPEGLRRKTPPKLPELAQVHVLRHYTRLSQENLGVDLNIDIGPLHTSLPGKFGSRSQY